MLLLATNFTNAGYNHGLQLFCILPILLLFKSEKLTFANRTANSFLYFKSISRLLMNN